MSTTRSARYRSSPSPAGALRLLALAAVATALALGCGGEPAPPTPATPPDTIAGCPSGSVEWTDGSCMPVGIQGCAAIFLEEDGLCHPRMAKCPAGTIPKFDEGCVPVGIQGCAAMFMEEDGLCHPSMAKCPGGTIPKFDEGCVPVGIQGCAEVFMEDDGLCHPTMEKCLAGTFAVPQEGCLPIDGPDGCGSGTWGNLQEDPDVETIWVDPSVAASGDGSKANPVKTIAEALAEVPEGGRIALGTGTYDEPIHVTKPMTIEGRCPSMVRVQGTGAADPYPFVVLVDAADDVVLRGLEIGGAGIGIVAINAAGLTVVGVHVRSATAIGSLLLGSTTSASIAKSWIEGTLADNDGLSGIGIEVTYGAQVTLAESAIVANRTLGVFASETGTEVTLTDSLVASTLPRESDGRYGRGANAQNGAELTFADSAIIKNHDVGVIAFARDTKLALSNSLVEGTLPSGPGLSGYGVDVEDGAILTLLGAAVLGNHDAGIVAVGVAEATVTGTLVEGTLFQQGGATSCVGVTVQDGANMTLGDSALIANNGIGLYVAGSAAEVTATGTLVQQQFDRGIVIHDGASVTLAGSAVVENRHTGILAHDPDSDVMMTGSLVAGTLHDAGDGSFGRGVEALSGAHAALAVSAILANRDVGLFVQQAGTEATATGNLIAGTLPQENNGTFGRGVSAIAGAKLMLDSNAIVENHNMGLFANGLGTVLTAMDNLIEGTLPDESDKLFGGGVGVQYGAHATVEANAIIANHYMGLSVGYGSSAIVVGNIIEGTRSRESDGQFGLGVVCSDNSTLELVSSIVRNNRVSALQVATATATVSQSFIEVVPSGSFTLNNSTRTFDNVGDGLLATLGSTLDITNTRIQGCIRAGVLFDDSTGTLSEVLSTGNQFGLVLQGERRPSYEGGNNQFTENTAQDIVTGGDLPVPDAPSPVPPSP